MAPQEDGDRRPRVLCVDDEINVLRALRRTLERAGWEVLAADSGPAALQILRTQRVQVLVCDEAMPGMTGVAVLREAKACSPHTQRLLLTAHCNRQEVVVPAVNEGEVFRLLAKPWDDDELVAAVNAALGVEPERWQAGQDRLRRRLGGLATSNATES